MQQFSHQVLGAGISGSLQGCAVRFVGIDIRIVFKEDVECFGPVVEACELQSSPDLLPRIFGSAPSSSRISMISGSLRAAAALSGVP